MHEWHAFSLSLLMVTVTLYTVCFNQVCLNVLTFFSSNYMFCRPNKACFDREAKSKATAQQTWLYGIVEAHGLQTRVCGGGFWMTSYHLWWYGCEVLYLFFIGLFSNLSIFFLFDFFSYVVYPNQFFLKKKNKCRAHVMICCEHDIISHGYGILFRWQDMLYSKKNILACP